MDESFDDVLNESGFRFDQLPHTIPFWDSIVYSNPLIARNRYELEYLPDYGSIGLFARTDSDDKTSLVPLKKNALNNRCLRPKNCCLPLICRWKRDAAFRNVFDDDFYENETAIRHYFRNNSCLDIDENLNLIISVDSHRKKVFFNRFVECSDSNRIPSILEILEEDSLSFSFSSKEIVENGLIREVKKSAKFGTKNVFCVKQTRSINYLDLEESPYNVSLKPLFNISWQQLIDQEDDTDEKIGLLQCESLNETFSTIAIGIINKNGRKQFDSIVYDVKSNKTLWNFNNELSYPLGSYWLSHPKLLAYGTINCFGLLDTRISGEQSFSRIVCKEDIENIRQWEHFKLLNKNPANDNQHLIATDINLYVFDVRFPKRLVMQWKHNVNSVNDLYFLTNSQKMICETVPDDWRNCYVLSLSNSIDTTIFTINSLCQSIHPVSLHPPLSVSTPSDCYYLSYSANENISEHVNSIELLGAKVFASKSGFSILQLTNKSDLFVQDFFSDKDFVDSDKIDYSWRFTPNLALNDSVEDYIKRAFEMLDSDAEDNFSEEKCFFINVSCDHLVCELERQKFFHQERNKDNNEIDENSCRHYEIDEEIFEKNLENSNYVAIMDSIKPKITIKLNNLKESRKSKKAKKSVQKNTEISSEENVVKDEKDLIEKISSIWKCDDRQFEIES